MSLCQDSARIWIWIRNRQNRIRGSGSGSIIIGTGSADLDLDPDPYQDETDPQHWKKYYNIYFKQLEYRVLFSENLFIGDASTLFIIQMLITPKVFGLEKRNCTF